MSFSRPIQWYHSHADPIWLDDTFKMQRIPRRRLTHPAGMKVARKKKYFTELMIKMLKITV
jgi:hypothetical protein